MNLFSPVLINVSWRETPKQWIARKGTFLKKIPVTDFFYFFTPDFNKPTHDHAVLNHEQQMCSDGESPLGLALDINDSSKCKFKSSPTRGLACNS